MGLAPIFVENIFEIDRRDQRAGNADPARRAERADGARRRPIAATCSRPGRSRWPTTPRRCAERAGPKDLPRRELVASSRAPRYVPVPRLDHAYRHRRRVEKEKGHMTALLKRMLAVADDGARRSGARDDRDRRRRSPGAGTIVVLQRHHVSARGVLTSARSRSGSDIDIGTAVAKRHGRQGRVRQHRLRRDHRRAAHARSATRSSAA